MRSVLNRSPSVACQPTRNLLGTPLLTQIRFDALNDRRRHLRRLRLVATTRQRFAGGLDRDDSRVAPRLRRNSRQIVDGDTSSVAAMDC